MNKQPRIAIFADAMTYPPKEGITAHVFSLLTALSKTRRFEVIFVLCDRGFIARDTVENFPWRTVLVPPSMYYDYPTMHKLLTSLKPTIVQSYNVYHARLILAPYSLSTKTPLVMEHHDSERSLASFLGLPESIATANMRAQADVAAVASLNRVMSGADMQQLQQLVVPEQRDTFVHIPVGIVDEFMGLTHTFNSESALFIGNGAYPPNRQAIDFLCNTVAPKLPTVRIALVGRMTEELARHSVGNIQGYGMVDDLSPLVMPASVGLIPIASGSGLKIKILSYMSAGMPIIGTPTAFEGFAPAPYLIPATLQTFVGTLSETLQRNDLHDLGYMARQDFLKDYEAQAVTDRLVSYYDKLTFCSSKTIDELLPISRDDSRLAWIHEIRENVHPTVEHVLDIAGSHQ